ncbi:MAG: hypothetical protein ABIE74_09775 [Pseudomonadota bacterium]
MSLSIRRYKYDWLVSLGIIFILAVVYGSLIIGNLNRFKELSLIYELRTLRFAVATFYLYNARAPNDFTELETAKHKMIGGSEYYLPERMRKQGAVKDPFGHPYVYSPINGWINSTTKEYVEW